MLLLTLVASCIVWLVLGAFAGYLLQQRSLANNAAVTDSSATEKTAASGDNTKASSSPPNTKRKERRSRAVLGAVGGTGRPTPSNDELEELRLKMVLVVRKDMPLTAGDVAAQASEAAVAVIAKTLYSGATNPSWIDWYNWWSLFGVAKITLRCPDEQSFNELLQAVQTRKLPYSVVASNAVLALGPAPAEELDPITGTLKLLS